MKKKKDKKPINVSFVENKLTADNVDVTVTSTDKHTIITTGINLQQQAMVMALERSLGIITAACRAVGIDRTTHYVWLKKNKEYRKLCQDIDNVALDFAESCLHKQIAKGNPLSTIFYLKCKAKKRGYIEQSTIEIKGNMKFRADFGTSNLIQSPSESTEDTQ